MSAKSSFFRQGIWMVIATFIGSIFMAGVQIEALHGNVLEESDRKTFIALLRWLMVFGSVPSAALQAIFAQQAATAQTDETRGELNSCVRVLRNATITFSLAVAALVCIFAGPVASALGLDNPAALRVTMLAVLPVICCPIYKGLLQGLHRFALLGWLPIIEGAVRLGTFVLLVKWLKGGATGGAWAILIGQYLIIAIAVWQTKDVWSTKTPAAFSWRRWSIVGVPLTLGMGAYVFMSIQVDVLFTTSLFIHSTNVDFYDCAMFIGFAMTQFIGPISAVMFPTIVRNLALSKKSNALGLTLGVTGCFALLAAVGCTLFPKLPIAILFPSKMQAAVLVPWFVWALVPLALANVLIQNLLARGRYAAAPWLFLVPIVYVLTLMASAPGLLALHDDFSAFKSIIRIMGFFCLLLFGVAAWFTWRKPATGASDRDSAAGR